MKTIEERAREFALKKMPYSPFFEGYEKMYEEIAAEQKAIDIDTIPQMFIHWLMIEGEKPTWKDYANQVM